MARTGSSCSGIEEDLPGLDHDDARCFRDPPCAAHDTPLMRAARRASSARSSSYFGTLSPTPWSQQERHRPHCSWSRVAQTSRTAASMLLRAAPNAVDVADNEGVHSTLGRVPGGSPRCGRSAPGSVPWTTRTTLASRPCLLPAKRATPIVKQLLAAGAPYTALPALTASTLCTQPARRATQTSCRCSCTPGLTSIGRCAIAAHRLLCALRAGLATSAVCSSSRPTGPAGRGPAPSMMARQ